MDASSNREHTTNMYKQNPANVCGEAQNVIVFGLFHLIAQYNPTFQESQLMSL